MTNETRYPIDEPRIQFDLEPDGHGRYKRIWIEQAVQDIDPITALQRQLAEAIPDFRGVSPDTFHVTLAHLGPPYALFADVRNVVPDVQFTDFLSALDTLLQKCDGAVTDGTSVQTTGVTLLGGGNVVVLGIAKTPEFMERREAIHSGIETFIRSFGIVDAEQFMTRSFNLKHEPNVAFAPHITLGRTTSSGIVLPQVTAPESVQLHPSRIRNVRKRK